MPSGMTTTVGSPLPMEDTARHVANRASVSSTSPEDGNKAYSYPAPLLQPQLAEGGRRGMSLPHSGTRQGTRSPSSKKHRCPYCATEFTRHHNLKSHLLTHSQEKPYVCSTCQSRFRRLHDLKRHTKLHTGERPHICPKCGRKFARGDALARHNKGPGGCAGRRSSMGSFGGDDDFEGDESMEGVMYGEPDTMDEDDGGSKTPGIPGIRRQAPSGDDNNEDSQHESRMPSTYPPIQGRPPGGMASGSYPPRGYGGPSAGPLPGYGQGQPLPHPHQSPAGGTLRSGPGGPMFAHNPLTESPGPLSPGPHGPQTQARGSGPTQAEGSISRNRSPSIPQYHPQQGSYPRPTNRPSMNSLNVPPSGPQLPPPHGLTPPDPRFTLPSQGGPAHPPTQPSGPPTHMGSGPLSSHSNSLASSGQAHSGHGSGEHVKSMFANDERLWAYVKSLEVRLNSMQDEIISLRTQFANATQPHTQQHPA